MSAKKTSKTEKVHYFNSKAFVQKVLDDCDLGEVSSSLRGELEEQVERRLAERITAVIVHNFEDKELTLFEKVMQDHPELDDIDAMTIVAAGIPDLQVKLLKGIQDLYEELTYDAREIQKAIDLRAQAENATI